MSAMAALTAETFTRLRRDRIFLPALITGALLMAIAHVASGWGIFEFHRILYDAGLTGYELTGVFVALVWSTGILADAKDSGALELSLATPLSRSMWIIAHYAGLCLVLLILAGIMLVCWQLVLFATGLSWITWPYLQVFLMATAGWMVVAALGILLGTLAGRGIAIFCTLGLWMAGQVTGPVYHAQHIDPVGRGSYRLSNREVSLGPELTHAQPDDVSLYLHYPIFTCHFPLVWIGFSNSG